ncbi:MAG: hypothetical protein K0Q90_14 [Paenibacillaceae bacterium]|jgi:hypothetical protein|nr:hypothetical protein [Paenibacillaceae bacterium]
MDREEYGRYLLSMMEEEEPDEDTVVEAEELFGFFQMFMPEGDGVEAIFEPLEDGDAYLKRIIPIYGMLDPADFSGDIIPGYFNAKRVEASGEALIAYGQQFIEGLKQLLDEDEEVSAYLAAVQQIELLPSGQIAAIRPLSDAGVYEALFDVVNQGRDFEEPIDVLGEAYYSIACDYWISYYLQWPRFGLKGDPLAPYFELYRRGYTAVFSEGKLFIGANI